MVVAHIYQSGNGDQFQSQAYTDFYFIISINSTSKIKVALGPRIDFQPTGETVDDALWHLREYGLAPGELDRAKKRLLLDFYLKRGLSARASRLAQYDLLEALPQEQRYADEIQAVTTADVQRIVDRYFSPRNRVVAVTGMARQVRARQSIGAQP